MSSNNEICVMSYEGSFHIWYNACVDNIPTKPDFDDQFYLKFDNRDDALTNALNLQKRLKKKGWFIEYGVNELN